MKPTSLRTTTSYTITCAKLRAQLRTEIAKTNECLNLESFFSSVFNQGLVVVMGWGGVGGQLSLSKRNSSPAEGNTGAETFQREEEETEGGGHLFFLPFFLPQQSVTPPLPHVQLVPIGPAL